MAKIRVRQVTTADPQWMAEPISGHLVAGGVKVDADAFPADLLNTGQTFIPSGTIVGRTFAEMEASAPFGPAHPLDDEIFILAFEIHDASEDNDATLLKGNVVIFENYLPEINGMDPDVLAKVRAKYICKQGVK